MSDWVLLLFGMVSIVDGLLGGPLISIRGIRQPEVKRIVAKMELVVGAACVLYWLVQRLAR